MNSIIEKIKMDDFEGAMILLEKFVIDNPRDIDIKLCSALLLQSVYIDDYHSALRQINEVLIQDPLNLKGILLMGYIEDTFQGDVSDNCFQLIIKYLNSGQKDEFFEQIYLLKALYYRQRNKEKYFDELKNSIEIDPFASYNHFLICNLYEEKKEVGNAVNAIDSSIKNIKHIYGVNEFVDPLDYKEFIFERYKGIHITQENFKYLEAKKAALQEL